MMKSADQYILSAMDGKEGGTEVAASRDGPSAFFFVVFGLVYEALAQSSTNTASTASNAMVTTAALEALESLVRPEYAGDAILDPTIFDEFTSLCYRMAMMETDDVHVPLVRTIASLASTQCSRGSKM
jgi:HEAT repeat-containing protein 5